MSSLLLLPSASLLPSFPCSVHGATAAAPTSPSSSWSPASSPRSRMHSLTQATASSLLPSYSLPASAQPSTAVVAHVLSSPAPRLALPAAAAAPGVGHAFAAAAAAKPISPPSRSLPSPLPAAPTLLNTAANQLGMPVQLQAGQSIVFDSSGQAFVLSPISNIAPAYQPIKQQTIQLQQFGGVQLPPSSVPAYPAAVDWQAQARQGSQQAMTPGSAILAHSNTIMLSPQQLQTGVPPSSMGVFSMGQFQPSQPVTFSMGPSLQQLSAGTMGLSPGMPFYSHGNVAALSSASFGGGVATRSSPVPAISSAFQPLPKRAAPANEAPSLTPSLLQLNVAAIPAHSTTPASPSGASGSRTPQRKMSAASSASTSSRIATSDGEAAGQASAVQLPFSPPTFARVSSEGSGGGDMATSPRIDGLSSSRLLTHIDKRPSHVLPFVIHRSQLPHNFDHLISPATSSSVQPSTPTSQDQPPSATAAIANEMVTVNIRVMGGPALRDLYFVAADISQLIHSRKSNIAKAVSVFTDDERARCSVVCPRSNNTQSTHILTVLTIAGVRRLLHSSRSTIALPLLAWLQDKVDQIVAQDDAVRPQQQQQQQQQQRRAAKSASGSKRKSDGARQEDAKEDDENADKRMKNE